jgi:hypothetical protein
LPDEAHHGHGQKRCYRSTRHDQLPQREGLTCFLGRNRHDTRLLDWKNRHTRFRRRLEQRLFLQKDGFGAGGAGLRLALVVEIGLLPSQPGVFLLGGLDLPRHV